MSTFTALGSASSTASANSIVLTTIASCAAGSLVAVTGTIAVTARPAGLTFTDSIGGNTWTIAIDLSNGAGLLYTVTFYSVLTNAIASGQTITMSWTTAAGFRGLAGIVCANPSSGSPLDSPPTKAANSSSNGTAASTGTTVAPATSDWVAVFGVSHGGASVLPQGTWTELADSSSIGWEAQAFIGTNTTAMRGSGTINTSTSWSCSVAVFELGAAAGATLHNLASCGAGA